MKKRNPELFREHYPDGRMVPQEGEKVYQTVSGPFGTAAHLYGVVVKGKSRGRSVLRVKITGAASAVFGVESGRKKTCELTPSWVVVGDPAIERNAAAREAKREAARQAEREEEQALERLAQQARSAALESGHLPIASWDQVAPGTELVQHTTLGSVDYVYLGMAPGTDWPTGIDRRTFEEGMTDEFVARVGVFSGPSMLRVLAEERAQGFDFGFTLGSPEDYTIAPQ